MKNIDDFFFGSLQLSSTGILSTDLSSVIENPGVLDGFSGRQLQRLLTISPSNILELSHSTSSPSFYRLLEVIGTDRIGKITIYARTDLNNAVDATLACDILTESGLIKFAPQWCAYKEIRAEEIISTLLCTLYMYNLERRTYINGHHYAIGEMQSLKSVIEKTLTEAKYPSAYRDSYIQTLKDAKV
tara:strand:- start:3447 stop:4007 length:561 start_codon:yes stop_codon:yes gene_type:complete